MLERAMDGVQAWELLNNPDYCRTLDMVSFHRLLKRAGYSEEASHKAAMQRGWDRLTAGQVI